MLPVGVQLVHTGEPFTPLIVVTVQLCICSVSMPRDLPLEQLLPPRPGMAEVLVV